MRTSVRSAWLAFTEPLEGGIPYFYADIRGLLTIAYGNLVDPLSAALPLLLVHPDGARATVAEVTAAWLAVKGDPSAARRGHLYAMGLTTLRLTREAMGDLALAKLENNDRILASRVQGWDDLPTCAQVAMHSWSWAGGPHTHAPRLMTALRARDFDAAAIEIHLNEWTKDDKGAQILNRGLVPRNRRNRILMLNAARVQAYKLDPDLLEWSELLGIQDAPTQPSLSSIPPAEPATAATHPTMAPSGIVHADPRLYFLERDPDDPDAA